MDLSGLHEPTLMEQLMASADGVAFVEHDDAGRIIAFGNMPAASFHFDCDFLKRRLIAGDGRPETHHVDAEGVIQLRPELDLTFDTTAVAVREAATMAGLPAASVSFDGPVRGRHQHFGGDLKIGWTMPGTYTVTIDAFPALPAVFEIKVGDTP